jgi:DNA mismatch repair ATPase MutL
VVKELVENALDAVPAASTSMRAGKTSIRVSDDGTASQRTSCSRLSGTRRAS